jgi:hypothetical protein
VVVLDFFIRKPKIFWISRIRKTRVLDNKIIINLLPVLTPRRIPKGGRTAEELVGLSE